jgi:polyhydroxyalkanoate synthesis regulator phasin
MGANSLLNVTTGFRNVGVGNNSGTNLVAGSYNVDIGWGVTGSGDETGIVRIGNPTYATATYVAAIAGTPVTGAAVYVTSGGQLGVLASSERYKTDITSLAADEQKLQQLRPVTFHLKTEPQGTMQYGLIAEEVDKVYPELVIRDEKGQIQGVRYDELAPILLREVQHQREQLTDERAQRAMDLSDAQALIAAQSTKLAAEDHRVAALEEQLAEVQQLKAEMKAALAQIQAKDSRVAMR